jgi:hypothetical protein
MAKLQEMDPYCMRNVTSGDFVPAMLKEMEDKNIGAAEAWSNRVQVVYMDPLNIPPQQSVAWNQENLNDIISRNPSLSERKFTLPTDSSRPYPIIGSTLVGPNDGAPYTSGDGGNRNFSLLEMTPLYIGAMNAGNLYHTSTSLNMIYILYSVVIC